MAIKLLQTFDGQAGSKPDPAIWKLADNVFLDNNELQASHPSQVGLDGQGSCVFSAVDKGLNVQPYPTARYLSGRMHSRNLFHFRYGRVKVTGRYPAGPMIYASLLWIGAYDLDFGPFPLCGEIDVNEAYKEGAGNAIPRSTMIGPGGTISHKLHRTIDALRTHTAICEWGPDKIETTFLQGEIESRHALTKQEAAARWVFDHEFFLVAGLGVKNPAAGQAFPAQMVLEHVEVEDIPIGVPQPGPIPQPQPEPTPPTEGGVSMNGAEFSSKDSRFTVDGTSIYARSTATNQPAWADYRLEFGMGGNSLHVEVDNEGELPVPAGYAYQIAVQAGNQQVGNVIVKPGEVGKLNLGMLTGLLVVRLAWLNDAWQPGVHDANLRIKQVSLVSNQTDPSPVSGKEQAAALLRAMSWPIEAINAVVNP